uniref:Stress-activated protein kinase JNK n=1 Tax=Acrobeloides nanus TaxID=290746 RepID=A0A914EJG0_9BILA
MKLQDFKTSLKTHTRMGCQFQIPSQYDLDYIIGSGSRGIVMRAQDLTKGRKVTIMHRKFPYYRNFVAKRVYREFQLLKVLKHKNITQLIQAYLPQDSTEVYFIMEYVDCPIRVLITEHNKFFQGPNTDHKLFLLLKQLLDGVDYLHQSNVVHGNLTPLNVMINENYELKITNLGYGKVLDEDILVFDTLTRHWTYCAPEMMLGKLYNVKVDIWSVGCIFAELITGKALFKLDDSDGETSIFEIPLDLRLAYGKLNSYLPTEIQNYMNLMKKLLSKHWDEILSDDKFPTDMQSKSLQNARDLLSKMLVIDSEKRLSAKEALKHAYLYRFDYSENIHNETYFKYDERIDSMKLSAEEWTELMINSVKEYESLRLV